MTWERSRHQLLWKNSSTAARQNYGWPHCLVLSPLSSLSTSRIAVPLCRRPRVAASSGGFLSAANRFATVSESRLFSTYHHGRRARANAKGSPGRRYDNNNTKPKVNSPPPRSNMQTPIATLRSLFRASPLASWPSFQNQLRVRVARWERIVFARYYATGQVYTRQDLVAILYRLPPWLFLVSVLTIWQETAPIQLIRVSGPSMLPTMATDGTQIWCIRLIPTWWHQARAWWNQQQPGTRQDHDEHNSHDSIYQNIVSKIRWPQWPAPWRRGDLVGFAHPDHPRRISCKRVVGLPGDVVSRYGEYVHLYLEQDPEGWGIVWPREYQEEGKDSTSPTLNSGVHSWINPSTVSSWDPVQTCHRDKLVEAQRTIQVPDGHVWLEADCPAMGFDSRHFGPIPEQWIKGRVVARVWPFWRQSGEISNRAWRRRPEPISLDDDTLRQYNLNRVRPSVG